MPTFWKVFFHEQMLKSIKVFSASVEMIICVCFQFIDVVYHIDWFKDIENSSHLCTNFAWIMVYDPLISCSICLLVFCCGFWHLLSDLQFLISLPAAILWVHQSSESVWERYKTCAQWLTNPTLCISGLYRQALCPWIFMQEYWVQRIIEPSCLCISYIGRRLSHCALTLLNAWWGLPVSGPGLFLNYWFNFIIGNWSVHIFSISSSWLSHSPRICPFLLGSPFYWCVVAGSTFMRLLAMHLYNFSFFISDLLIWAPSPFYLNESIYVCQLCLFQESAFSFHWLFLPFSSYFTYFCSDLLWFLH